MPLGHGEFCTFKLVLCYGISKNRRKMSWRIYGVKISLSRLVPPLINSLVIRWKFVFPLVEQSISSGSGAATIVYLRLMDVRPAPH